jgi:hypothetical protein
MPCDAVVVRARVFFRRGAWVAGGGRSFLKVLPSYQNQPLSYQRAFFTSSHRVVLPTFTVNGRHMLPGVTISDSA